jgi:tRNA (guanine37-N1)-methyltransferase
MRIDVISIFPAYLEPLRLSLPGKAQQAGLLDLRVHDLRDWTHDRHRTVDDTPYGGGAGMVMRPEPWGEALDAVTDDDTGTRAREPVLVVPSPAGEPFSQRVAEELATRPWLVFACGRYEGIDARVVEHARARMPVRELSVGDYVLNGGEAAALVITEAVVRLLPGFMGNPESLSEESHGAAGLLEYPLYTKPPVWRGLEVPAVLLSGDHGAIARWRHDQSLRRTTDRRPDLLHASRTLTVADLPDAEVRTATPADAAELLVLQRACWVQEAVANDSLAIPPLHDSLDDVLASIATWRTVVVRSHGRLVGSVRARLDGDTWEIGRIMVAADLQGRGLGRWLLEHIEALAPEQATRFFLLTGSGSVDNLRMYRKAGYRPVEHARPGVVHLSKRRR